MNFKDGHTNLPALIRMVTNIKKKFSVRRIFSLHHIFECLISIIKNVKTMSRKRAITVFCKTKEIEEKYDYGKTVTGRKKSGCF